MLESDKLMYYGLSLAVLAGGVIMFIVYGFMYLIMYLSNSLAEIQSVKNKFVIATYLVSTGVVLFFITLGLDYKHVFDKSTV
jgi:magnesium-transporting ATPase (P-type)